MIARTALPVLLALALIDPLAALAQRDSHIADCTTLQGLRKARCERHERMFAKCHAIKGEAHHECDRQFILAQPLDCSPLAGRDAESCAAEHAALEACKGELGTAFFRCARERLRTDPRH